MTPQHRIAWAAVALAIPLLGGCANSTDVEDQPSYLDEVFHFDLESDVQYGTTVDEFGQTEALHLDLFYPTDDDQPLRPAIIWLHGGSFQVGNKGEMTEFARRYARRGFVSATANYRLRENAAFDYTDPADSIGEVAKHEAQHDVQAAVRWLRANAGTFKIDPARIFVAGYSAGGTTALRVAAHPNDVGSSGNPGLSSSVVAAVAISGSLEPGALAITAGSTLLIHGESDAKVPFAQIQAACAVVAKCRLVGIPLGLHNMINLEKEPIIAAAAIFLNAEATAP